MGVYQNSRAQPRDIREGLAKAGPRSAPRQMATNAELGAAMMRDSEERLARQRPQLVDPSSEENLTAEEWIAKGLAQARARGEPSAWQTRRDEHATVELATAMMSTLAREQSRISGKANYTPERSERRQAVIETARPRQAAAKLVSRRREAVRRSRRGR